MKDEKQMVKKIHFLVDEDEHAILKAQAAKEKKFFRDFIRDIVIREMFRREGQK